MRRLPSISPEPDDHGVYMVLDDFGGRLGRGWRESDEERTDRAAVVESLLEGRYSDPVRVVAFNTGQGWSLDVSQEIAGQLAPRIAFEDRKVPATLEGFLDRHCGGWPIQLLLPMRVAT